MVAGSYRNPLEVSTGENVIKVELNEITKMMSAKERQKIEEAFQKVKYNPLISLSLLTFLLGIVIFGTIRWVYDILAVSISIIGLLVFTSFFGYIIFSEIFALNIEIREDGLKIYCSKRRKKILGEKCIIKYKWIETAILNERGNGGLYIDVFFTIDKKRYIYRDYQKAIKGNYPKFITELRKRGIEVKVLEPSYKHQKNHDFGWIADMMRGREFV